MSRQPFTVDAVSNGQEALDYLRAKPAPDLLLFAARELGVEPSRSRYVGDSVWDMQAAVAAGMPAIGVVSGSATAAELAEAGAFLTVKELTELIPPKP